MSGHENGLNATNISFGSTAGVGVGVGVGVPIFYRHAVLTVTYVLLNVVICVVGVVGNGMIVALFCRQRRMRTDTNVFIMNLAISDVLICCVSPGTSINTLLMDKQWTLGLFLCKTVPALTTVAVFSSSFTMTAVALNRYLVAHSNRHLLNWQRWLLVTGLWAVSALFSLPIGVHSQIVHLGDNDRCVEKWDDGHASLRTAFTLSCLAVQFVLPTGIIAYCYSKLSAWLNVRSRMYEAAAVQESKSSGTFYLSSELNRHRNVASIRRKRITNRMLIVIVVVYCCSWLPLNVLNVLLEFHPDVAFSCAYLEVMYMFSQILAASSAALNPCIFASLNKDYQRHLKSYLRSSKTHTVVNFRLRVPQNLLPSGSSPPVRN